MTIKCSLGLGLHVYFILYAVQVFSELVTCVRERTLKYILPILDSLLGGVRMGSRDLGVRPEEGLGLMAPILGEGPWTMSSISIATLKGHKQKKGVFIVK